MDYSLKYSNGYCIVTIGNQLSMLSNIDFLRNVIINILKKGNKRIAIRFPNSSFLSSHSITVLIACNELVKDAGGEMMIAGGGSEFEEYLSTLGIREQFTLCGDAEKVINHL